MQQLSKKYGNLCSILALLVEAVIFYSPVLFSNQRGIPYDLDGYHRPLAGFIVASLRKGALPLWDPYTYCGVPLYANIQAQLFYPAAWPFFLLAVIHPNHLFRLLECEVAFHVFLAGALTYALLRSMKLSRGAALLGGTIFQLGGFFASQAQHLGAVCGSAWMPLAWMAVLLLAARFSWKRFGLLAFAFGMAILAGFPATAGAVIGSSILLALLLVALRHARPHLLAYVPGAVLLAALLSAVELLPARQLSRLSIAAMRAEWTVSGGGLPLQSFASMLMPNYYRIFDLDKYTALHLKWNPTFLYLYCGIAGLALGLFATVWAKHRYRLVFVLLSILCALWMLCDNTPVGKNLFPLLPKPLKGSFYPEFVMAAFLLGFTVLAALGAERLLAPRGLVVMALVIVGTACDLTHTGANTWMNTYPGNAFSYRQVEGSYTAPGRMRALVREIFPPSRFDVGTISHNWVAAAPMLEVPTAGGDDPLALWRLLQVRLCFAHGDYWMRYYEVAKPQSRVLDLLNIGFLLTRSDEPLDAEKWVRRDDLPGAFHLYQNLNVLPRFFLVNQVRRARDLSDALTILRSDRFDPAHTAVIETEAAVPADPSAPSAGGARVTAYRNRELELETAASGDRFLVSSEVYYPGWRAWIDGREAPLIMTNGAFRGLAVSAGRHRIRMRFEPSILWYGAAISLAGWLLLALCVLLPFPWRAPLLPDTLSK